MFYNMGWTKILQHSTLGGCPKKYNIFQSDGQTNHGFGFNWD